MAISPRDGLALLIAVGAAVASVVVWDYGKVDVGMTLNSDGEMVHVDEVTPDGNAARRGFTRGVRLLDVVTTDGGEVERGEPLGVVVDGALIHEPEVLWDHLGPIGAELRTYDADYRPPAEAIDSARIAVALAGDVDPECRCVYTFASLERGSLELLLRQSIWVVGLGFVIGVAVWRLLVHGIAGATGRRLAIVVAVAAAVPFLLLPVVQVGTQVGMFAVYLVPLALALVLGISLSRGNPDRAWSQTAIAAAFVTAGLAALFVLRYLTTALAPDERGAILLLIAATAVVPTLVAGVQPLASERERAGNLSLAAVPAAALTLILPPTPDPWLPVLLLAGLLGWQLLPLGRAYAAVSAGLGQLRAPRQIPGTAEPALAAWRDRLILAIFAVVVVRGLGGEADPWPIIVGIGLAALVGVAIRRSFLGPDWADAAIPIAASVGLPIAALGFSGWYYGGAMGWVSAPTALSALSVAHVLSSRHSDAGWRARLFLVSGALAAVAIFLGAVELPLAIVLSGLVPLIPGLPTAFVQEPGETRLLTSRLETLAVALTPGIAATMLAPAAGMWLLGAWLVAIVVWRRFTLAPLLGLAQRTQLQRDLAVAAAETERARLAADLHDDALQQLTMLVRTLDEGGQKEAADEAREIATKLRSVVGDLRLPILDDLGAGAALEWLVERVEPLAGGPVKLERSDETRPPANVELAIFRVAQEALTNAIKHGRPPIAVRYDVRTDGRVTLAIDDAGEGIGAGAAEEAPRQGHFGLANMQQRAEHIGALLDVRRWPAGGTRVALEWRPQ